MPQGFEFLSGLPEAARKRRYLMPVQVFVDDSGGKGQGRFLCSVGLLAHSDQWAIFSDEWKACLEKPPTIAYFKMHEAFHLVKQFRHFSEPERDAKLLDLAKIINEHVGIAFFSAIDLEAHAETWAVHCTKPMNEPFFWTFHNTIHAAMFELWDIGWREQFEIIFDDNVIFGPRAKAYYPAIRAGMRIREPEASVLLPADPMFRSDLSFLPIQACDFIAWAGRRDVHFPENRPFPWLDGVITKPYVSDYSQFYDRERMEAVLKESREHLTALMNGTALTSAIAAANEFMRMRNED